MIHYKRLSIFLIVQAVLVCSLLMGQTSKTAYSKPSFGVILNEDGDFAFLDSDTSVAKKLLKANVDGHAAIGVKTYVFSLGAGSDVLYYPTKTASPYGWRTTRYETENESWKARVNSARNCIANGMDALQIAGEQAKKNNMLFIPSMRMNDSHFMSDPYNYPLTGKFWLDNAPGMTIKESPVVFNKDYGNLLDFSFEKVRNYRLDVINEAIDRNKRYMDGFELDFNRVQVFFPKGKAAERKHLITDMVRKVRIRLNNLSKELHRPLYLFVRTPPSTESCEWAGLDINQWINEKLIDLISPSQLMTLPHDMPITDIIKEAKKNNVQVYPSLYPRTSYRVPLEPSQNTLGMENNAGRIATLPETLAAAANYRWMGADGFYLFNYKGGSMDEGLRPHPEWMYALVSSLAYNKPDAGDKVFAITKTYYNDNVEPSYAYVKQLPRKLSGLEKFILLVGELPNESAFPLATCVLRVSVKNFKTDKPVVMLNGNLMEPVKISSHLSSNNGKALAADMAEYSFLFAINDTGLLRKGENQVSVDGVNMVVTDIEIGYAYYNTLNLFMLGKKLPKLNSLIK